MSDPEHQDTTKAHIECRGAKTTFCPYETQHKTILSVSMLL